MHLSGFCHWKEKFPQGGLLWQRILWCFLSTVTILLIIMIAPCLRQTPLKTAQGYCIGLVKTAQDRKATTKASIAALAEDTPGERLAWDNLRVFCIKDDKGDKK